MNTSVPTRRGTGRAFTRRPSNATAIAVEVLVCGSVDRGDDGAPLRACQLLGRLPADVRLRAVGQLDVDHLLSIPAAAGVVIVDAAVGLERGAVIELPLAALRDGTSAVRLRSSHVIAVPEVVGVAEMIRGRPLPGRIVAIGAFRFGIGQSLSHPVSMGLPAFAAAILAAIGDVRSTGALGGAIEGLRSGSRGSTND